jgi:hypothetical protein
MGAQLTFRGDVSLSSACSKSSAKIESNVRPDRRIADAWTGDDLGIRLNRHPMMQPVITGFPSSPHNSSRHNICCDTIFFPEFDIV